MHTSGSSFDSGANAAFEEAEARLEMRGRLGKAAWRLMMPPVSIKRKVTILIFDQFNGETFPSILRASVDNRTSVIAIEARDLSPDNAEQRVMALVRLGQQSVIRTHGSLWAGERGQACVVFHPGENPTRVQIGHHGKLRILEGGPTSDFAAGVRCAAERLLHYAEANDNVPTAATRQRMPGF